MQYVIGREPISMIYQRIRWLLRGKRARSHYLYVTPVLLYVYRAQPAHGGNKVPSAVAMK